MMMMMDGRGNNIFCIFIYLLNNILNYISSKKKDRKPMGPKGMMEQSSVGGGRVGKILLR